MRVDTLIELAGGVARLAEALGVAHPTVCGWRKDGFIPGGRLVQISEVLGIPLARLAPLVRPPPGVTHKPRSRRAA